MRFSTAAALATAATVSFTAASDAALLATWDFTGAQQDSTSFTPPAGAVAAGVDAGALTLGPGLNAGLGQDTHKTGINWSTNDDGNPAPAVLVNTNDAAATVQGAIDAGDYLSFTIAPEAGYTMTLESVVLDARRSANNNERIQLRSSLDSFASSLGEEVITTYSDWTEVVFALSGSFADLGSEIEFRLYTSSAAGSTGRHVGFDNFEVNGSAVPEPASLALMGLGGLAMLRRRRGA